MTCIGCLPANFAAQGAISRWCFRIPYGSLDPRQTVARIVAEPLTAIGNVDRAEQRARVAAVLKQVGLRDADMDKFPHEFSGGQRQRIAIARALITQPKLIVADEPVSALDVSVQAQVLNLLEDLQDEFGLSYVLISHDLAVVEYLCDEIAVIYLGRIVEQGRAGGSAQPLRASLYARVARGCAARAPGPRAATPRRSGDRVAIVEVDGLRLRRAVPLCRRALQCGSACGAQRRSGPSSAACHHAETIMALPPLGGRSVIGCGRSQFGGPFGPSRSGAFTCSRNSLCLRLTAIAALSLLPQPVAAQGKKDSVVMAMALEPPGLDPTSGAAAAIAEVTLYNVYETLTKVKEDGTAGAVARRKLDNVAGREDLHVQAAQGRQVPERRTVERGDGKILVRAVGGAGQHQQGQEPVPEHRRDHRRRTPTPS